MYYKIENKNSQVYKKLHALRTIEKKIEKDNIKSIVKKTGQEYNKFLGHHGQQNFRRVIQYEGFEFLQPEKLDMKIWKKHHIHDCIFVPNRKTKLGREMAEFLLNGLKGSRFDKPMEILGLEYPKRFTFPYCEIVKKDIIVLYLDDSLEPKDKNVIEITRAEFTKLTK